MSKNTALKELFCSFNQLTELDLSQNPLLIYIESYENKYPIKVTNTTFDLAALPKSFDIKKASNWTNATVDDYLITITDPTQNVTYTYDLGNGTTETFALNITSVDMIEEMLQPIAEQIFTGDALTPIALKYGDYTLVQYL